MWKPSTAYVSRRLLRDATRAFRLLLRGALSAGLCGCALAGTAWAQRQALPPGPMQERARELCLACHDARIILQQRLDQRAWTKVIDKMIRWGTPVAPEEREALIDYFAQHFGLRELHAGRAVLAEAPGAEKVREACLSCHDAGVIVEQKLDRRGWARVVERQIRWGAAVRPEDHELIINYLAKNYPAATEPAETPRREQAPAPPKRKEER